MNKHKKRQLIESPGLSVNVIEGDIKFALRDFQKQVKDSGILKEVRQRKHFEKPSRIRKEQLDKAKYKQYMSHQVD